MYGAGQVVAEPSRNFNISRRERLKIQPPLLVVPSARYYEKVYAPPSLPLSSFSLLSHSIFLSFALPTLRIPSPRFTRRPPSPLSSRRRGAKSHSYDVTPLNRLHSPFGRDESTLERNRSALENTFSSRSTLDKVVTLLLSDSCPTFVKLKLFIRVTSI